MKIVDFNLFGILGIRLVNSNKQHEDYIARLTGSNPATLNGEPDITIIYKDIIDTENLTYVGLDAGFDENNFYLLKGNSKVSIPFDKIGKRLEIICENEIIEIPLMNYLIYLAFISKRWIGIHSSSFELNGNGILVTGWTKGGKTEILLTCLMNGAKFVTDEWTIISENGKLLFGMPVAITIWEWYFNEVKSILPRIKIQKKVTFSFIRSIQYLNKLIQKSIFSRSELSGILGRVVKRSKKNLNIRVLPEDMNNLNIASGNINLNKIIFTISKQSSQIQVSKFSSEEVIERMIHSNREEYNNLFNYYYAFRFAFPDRKNELLEDFDAVHKELFTSCFKDKLIYKVEHPYPVPIKKLFDLLQEKIFNS